MTLRLRYQTDGYVVLKGIFSKDILQNCKQEILTFQTNHTLLHNASGYTIPDFIRFPDLSKTTQLKENPHLHAALFEIFAGDNYRFCSHNDIGINRVVSWHKDKLNGSYASFQKTPIWSTVNGEVHEIVKVLIYLEDHPKGAAGLRLVPKSHLINSLATEGSIPAETELGDVIIFDQRITHRGMEKQVAEPRILISFGFGRNNCFTDEFEQGTIARQKAQSN